MSWTKDGDALEDHSLQDGQSRGEGPCGAGYPSVIAGAMKRKSLRTGDRTVRIVSCFRKDTCSPLPFFSKVMLMSLPATVAALRKCSTLKARSSL